MEIQNTGNFLIDSYTAGLEKNTELRSRPGLGNSSESNATPSGDRVSVSRNALLMTEARRAAQNAPDVRTDKVEALRIQVANGTYKPDTRLIAENLLREEPGLFRL